MSHTIQITFVSLSPIRRAWIAAILLFVALVTILFTVSTENTSAQIVERTVSDSGIIAYVTANHEIWASHPDGSNAHKIWEIPQEARANMMSGPQNLTWRSDGTILAFVSGHEPQCSLYETNIYTINADGSNLQRLTNRPSCQESAALATGTVTVDIRNGFNQIQIAEITVEGAMEPTFVSLLPGLVKQVTIANVPDLGAGVLQSVVAVEGSYRWFMPGTDVVAGQNVYAGELQLSAASRISSLKVWSPSWSANGQKLAFLLAGGIMQQIPLQGSVLQRSVDLLSGEAQGIYPSELALSPVDDTVIFTAGNVEGGRGVYRSTVGSSDVPVRVVNVDDTRGLAWLPDGSGFVMVNYFAEFFSGVNSNLWHIDLVNSQAHQLTAYENEFAFNPSIAPDGQQFAFNYAPNLQPETPSEVRIMPLAGGNAVPFGPSNIAYTAWGKETTTTNPTPTATSVPPTATPTTGAPTATPTTVTPTATPTSLVVSPTATPQPGSSDHTLHLSYLQR